LFIFRVLVYLLLKTTRSVSLFQPVLGAFHVQAPSPSGGFWPASHAQRTVHQHIRKGPQVVCGTIVRS